MVKIANKEPPTEEVISLRNEGKSNSEIMRYLSQRGFNNTQIYEAINQADIKGGVEGRIPPQMSQNNFSTSMGSMQPSALTSGSDESEIPIPVPSPKGGEDISQQSSSMPEVQQPSSQFFAQNVAQPSIDVESVQEIVESIIDERWQEVVAGVGDIAIWKSRVEDDLVSIKQEILRVEDRFSKLQTSIIGKVDEYQRGITQVSSEMIALEKVFSKIMEPLTSNIKELQRLTQDIKKKS